MSIKHPNQNKNLSTPILTYFACRGRTEPIRLLLNYCGVSYIQKDVAVSEWPALKPEVKKLNVFGQMPIYEFHEDGTNKIISQSMAILRFLGQKYGTCGANADEAVLIDMYCEFLLDVIREVGTKMCWNPNHEKDTPELWKGYLNGQQLPVLNNLLELNGHNGYLVGKSYSNADFCAFNLLSTLTTPENAQPFLKEFPKIQSYLDSMAKDEKIAAYVKSDRRFKGYTVSIAPNEGVSAF